MNQHLNAAERMRLLPRLRILRHATQLLNDTWSHLPCELRGQYPVQWNTRQKRHELLFVRSLRAFFWPELTDVLARCWGNSVSDIAPDRSYQLPIFEFSGLDPHGKPSWEHRIEAGIFKTFAQGQGTRQLLEYLATLLDLELATYGFRCRRQGQRLCLEAEPEAAGWNVRLHQLFMPNSVYPPCDGGLYAGLSSLDSHQESGMLTQLSWGPYRINGQRCQVILSPTLSAQDGANTFLNELTSQLVEGVSVSWDDFNYLCLQSTSGHLEIIREPKQTQDGCDWSLDLPIGQFQSEPLATQEELQLNDQFFSLILPSRHSDANLLLAPLQKRGFTVGIDSAGHFYLKAPYPVQIVSISPLLEEALGLQAASNTWVNLWERWLQLHRHIANHLPIELQSYPEIASPAWQDWLSHLPIALDALHAQLSEGPGIAPQIQEPKAQKSSSLVRNLEQTEEDAPTQTRFDYQI